MLTVNTLKIRRAMKAQGMTAADLAARAKLNPAIISDIVENKELKFMDFTPLVALGTALKVSPFSLIQNHTII